MRVEGLRPSNLSARQGSIGGPSKYDGILGYIIIESVLTEPAGTINEPLALLEFGVQAGQVWALRNNKP